MSHKIIFMLSLDKLISTFYIIAFAVGAHYNRNSRLGYLIKLSVATFLCSVVIRSTFSDTQLFLVPLNYDESPVRIFSQKCNFWSSRSFRRRRRRRQRQRRQRRTCSTMI